MLYALPAIVTSDVVFMPSVSAKCPIPQTISDSQRMPDQALSREKFKRHPRSPFGFVWGMRPGSGLADSRSP